MLNKNKLKKTIEKLNLSNKIGCHIFNYSPKNEIDVRRGIDLFKKADKNVVIFDLYNVITGILREKGYLEKCYLFEKKNGFERVIKSINRMLRITSSNNLITQHIKENTPEKAVIFITGIGKCYPILRLDSILEDFNSNLKKYLIIFFYPGTFEKETLMLFGEVEDINYYNVLSVND